MHKAVLILLGWSLVQTIGSCCTGDYTPVRWSEMHLSSLVVTGNLIDVPASDTVPLAQFGIRLSFHAVAYARLWDHLPSCNSAAACSYAGHFEDTIREVAVVTRYAYDPAHGAGSDITGLLRARRLPHNVRDLADTAYRSLPEALAYLNNPPTHAELDQGLELRPATGPAIRGRHQFQVTTILGSGTSFTASLNAVLY